MFEAEDVVSIHVRSPDLGEGRTSPIHLPVRAQVNYLYTYFIASNHVQRLCPTDETRGESTRGAIRSDKKRALETIVNSRPPTLISKMGTEGRPVPLITNYFRTVGPKWLVYTYRVDFRPDIEDDRIKKRLLREHRALFGGYLFDGTRIFCTKYLEILGNSLELNGKLRESDELVVMDIKFTGELSMQDNSSLQVLNLIMRKAMAGLNMQLVGRNYYDAAARVCIQLMLGNYL